MIPVKNIYYMLAYCFTALRQDDYKNLAAEEFDGAEDLCAAVLACGLKRLIRKGIGSEYINRRDEIPTVRGRIDVAATIKAQSVQRGRLICEYEEFSTDTARNRAIKSTMLLVLSSPRFNPKRKRELKRLLPYFDRVGTLNLGDVDWKSLAKGRTTNDYDLLLYICRLIVEGLLPDKNNKGKRRAAFIDDQEMSHLYEKFILNYYRMEHKELTARASQVPWALDSAGDDVLPVMQTDVTLNCGNQVLIIDAKYYETTMQERFKRTLRSGNLYQIFCYVKNKQIELGPGAPPVSGMLLYAKTDETIVPNNIYIMSGNTIEVRTLDLSGDFKSIRDQLDDIVEKYFAFAIKSKRFLKGVYI